MRRLATHEMRGISGQGVAVDLCLVCGSSLTQPTVVRPLIPGYQRADRRRLGLLAATCSSQDRDSEQNKQEGDACNTDERATRHR